LAFLITLASIYRLARFNITPSSQLDFQGMPTPAFTLFVVGIPFIPFEKSPIITLVITALLTLLMVSKIMLPSQKFVNGKPSSFAWLFALVFIPILLIFRTQALSATILAYAIFGILYMRLKG
jgi:CDP-diacylglycerol--serine O-phosphatidyltransferase